MVDEDTQMNLVQKLLNYISEKKKSIVIIGDAMVDVWVHGQVHTGCQDNCVKFVEESRCETPGGAANAQQCLQHWGVPTPLFAGRERCRKTRYVGAGGGIVFRTDEDVVSSLTMVELSVLLEVLPLAGAVLLSDYDKGALPINLIRGVVFTCKEHNIPCVADCKRALEVYEGCVLKGNNDWFQRGRPNILHCKDKMVITMGMYRPAIWDDGWRPCREELYLQQVKCVNHVGAGDCFAAHLTLALAYGFSLMEAVALAHSVGRVYVQHPHNQAPLPSEIEADFITTAW